MVIEVMEKSFLIKTLESDTPKTVEKELGTHIYAQGNHVFGVKNKELTMVSL